MPPLRTGLFPVLRNLFTKTDNFVNILVMLFKIHLVLDVYENESE